MKTMKGNSLMQEPVHPGYYIGEELKSRGMTRKALAMQIGLQPSHLTEVIKGKRNISSQLAAKLEETLGLPAAYWIKLQLRYDYEVKLSEQQDEEVRKAENELSKYDEILDMRTIYKSIGISKMTAPERLEFCENILGLQYSSELQRKAIGWYHRSEKTGNDPRMIATWTALARYSASQRPIPQGKFDKNRMDDLAFELREIFMENHNTMNRVEWKLAEYGIRFCITPKVKLASVDGFSFIKDGVPAIVVTKRFDRIDNLSFAVLHEVGHLKMHSDRKEYESNLNLATEDEDLLPKIEAEANKYAAEILIPNDLWKDAPQVPMNPYIIQKKYSAWAMKQGLNKWIALGRVSHETGMYMFKSDETRCIN